MCISPKSVAEARRAIAERHGSSVTALADTAGGGTLEELVESMEAAERGRRASEEARTGGADEAPPLCC